MAESRRDEIGYLERGDFCWVIGAVRDEETGAVNVHWVSADYFIYTNEATDFRITPAQLSQLLRNGRGPTGDLHSRL